LLVVPAASAQDATPVATVTLGALLPMTGALEADGAAYGAALSLAVADVNASAGPADLRLAVALEDSRTVPAVAREKLDALASRGVRVVIGPDTSAEAAALVDLATARDVLVISPASTAGSLSIPGDNLFRFTPDDQGAGKAVAEYAWSSGTRTLAPLVRDDAGALGLLAAVTRTFEEAGGVVLEPVIYGADQSTFAADLRTLNARVAQARATSGSVGVFHSGFGETASLFAEAGDPGGSVLEAVPWYGGDGATQNDDLVKSRASAAFAARVGYPAPALALDDADRARWQPLQDRLTAQLGHAVDAYTLGVYDSVQVAYQALSRVGPTAPFADLKTAFVSAANGYHGATGSTALNAAGDRQRGSYDFWAICPVDDDYAWLRVASYGAGPSGVSSLSRRAACNAGLTSPTK
jgi:branched-chain amino acid transport system substrate-binding protein